MNELLRARGVRKSFGGVEVLHGVDLDAASGSIVAAVPPVAVGAGNVEVSQRVADVCLRALALAVPVREVRVDAGVTHTLRRHDGQARQDALLREQRSTEESERCRNGREEAQVHGREEI